MKDIIKNDAANILDPVILLAPLDWGLGHAARCVPLISYMITLNYKVIIAGEGPQIDLLKQEFPTLQCVNLPGYKLRYAASGWKTFFMLIFQIPKILISIKREQRWLNAFLKDSRVDAVISDNRYGLFHNDITSVFITHQLNIKSFSNNLGESFLRKINYRFINKFSECWVPDYQGQPNLAGKLSHPPLPPATPVRYIGPLTRINHMDLKITNELLILISGPEPQRTILENICLKELKDYNEPAILVRGLPGNKEELNGFNRLTIYNHLPSQKMNAVINASRIILSRSGYSTVMDLINLRKICIFIPTPGQTEQIYLAKYLSAGKYCLHYAQERFSLAIALKDARKALLLPFEGNVSEDYKVAVKALPR